VIHRKDAENKKPISPQRRKGRKADTKAGYDSIAVIAMLIIMKTVFQFWIGLHFRGMSFLCNYLSLRSLR
jgi:hypothetical protein